MEYYVRARRKPALAVSSALGIPAAGDAASASDQPVE
jgi:hypothetical protein